MFETIPFSHKSIEKYLLSMCGKGVRKDKPTMDYIRKTAHNVETAYKIGVRDGQNGDPLVKKEQLNPGASSASELLQSAVDFAYEAYRAGHMAGTAKRGET